MKWIAKAVVQKTISFLPYKDRINNFLQRKVSGAVYLDDQHFRWKLEHARDHWKYYLKYSNTPASSLKVLELGTGWYPIVPMYFYLHGCNEFHSVDIYQWLKKHNYQTVIKKLTEWKENGKLKDFDQGILTERWNSLQSFLEDNASAEQINQSMGFQPIIGNAAEPIYSPQQFNFICSNNVFEHIYPDVLGPIIANFRTWLTPNGLMSHFIDLSDHFAHSDTSITEFNFLRFTPAAWRLIDNDIQPQNRMRWPQYIDLYRSLNIPVTEQTTRQSPRKILAAQPIHNGFTTIPVDQLRITHGYIVTKL